MKIAKAILKDKQEVHLGSFTLLVGPNNVGKSQTLRDIYTKLNAGVDAQTTIIQRLDIPKPSSWGEFSESLRIEPAIDQPQNRIVRGLGSNLQSRTGHQINIQSFEKQYAAEPTLDFMFGNIMQLFVAYLNAETRLQVAGACASINPHEQIPERLLQSLFESRPAEADFLEAFRAAFDLEVRLDLSGMSTLALRIAKSFPKIPEDPRDQYPVMKEFPLLDLQGDGFRSFAGVVLSILLCKRRIILLDEPEAFLHPAQARILGKWVARHSSTAGNQIIVASHNANFLAGALEAASDVTIYRMNRHGDNTEFNRMSPEATKALSENPILSSQRVLEAIFHRGVIVCEADSDRTFYNAVANQLARAGDFLFVHAHNKQTIPSVIKILQEANIKCCAVVDIDGLNSSSEFKKLLAVCRVEKATATRWLELRSKVGLAVDGISEEEVLRDVIANVREFRRQLRRRQHTLSGARAALARIRGGASKWETIKENGLAAIPLSGRGAAEILIGECAAAGLFIVPVGVVESWIRLGVRKKSWLPAALESLQRNPPGSELAKFVRHLLLFVEVKST